MKGFQVTLYSVCFVGKNLLLPFIVCMSLMFSLQLMRELKEGLRIAVLHRQRYLTLIHTVLWDKEKETLELYESVVSEFDQSMKAVLKVSHLICLISIIEVLV
jgi:hypothetical protein